MTYRLSEAAGAPLGPPSGRARPVGRFADCLRFTCIRL